MIPAENWAAKLEDRETPIPLACWSLIETERDIKLKGMIAAGTQIVPCDCFGSFVGYEAIIAQ